MSPVTMPWFSASGEVAASPVSTPPRACSGRSIEAPRAATASTSSRPARTARSASSSWVIGVPHTAMTASPMNFSTTPPWRSITVRAVSKYASISERMSSASRCSESVVNDTRSRNSTETRRRSVECGAASAVGSSSGALPPTASDEPHSPQNLPGRVRTCRRRDRPCDRRAPHSRQNLRSGSFWVPHAPQVKRDPFKREGGSVPSHGSARTGRDARAFDHGLWTFGRCAGPPDALRSCACPPPRPPRP